LNDPNCMRSVARHEAGHAVAAVVLGLELKSVSIGLQGEPDGQISLGATHISYGEDYQIAGRGATAVVPRLIPIFAGIAAESAVNPAAFEAGAFDAAISRTVTLATVAYCVSSDCGNGQRRIAKSELDRNKIWIEAVLAISRSVASSLVDAYRAAIDTIANQLVSQGSLTCAEVHTIVLANPPQ
jgi:hypothetical protein